jgi:hypothetical protein
MLESRLVSEFTIRQKDTPNTAMTASSGKGEHCSFCMDNLASATALRKNEIFLELEVEQLKERVERLEKEKEALVNDRVLTYHEYQIRV